MDYSLGLFNLWLIMIPVILPNLLFFLTKASQRNPPTDFEVSSYEKLLDRMEMFMRFFLIILSIFIPFDTSGRNFIVGGIIVVIGLLLYYTVWFAIFTTPIDHPVTKGIYSYARHPGRIFPLVIFIGMAILAESLIFFLISILFIGIHISNYKVEERYLLEKYGDEYNQYLKTTPRYFIRKIVPF